jgi:deoxyadenosine/deoxycytidine kinase
MPSLPTPLEPMTQQFLSDLCILGETIFERKKTLRVFLTCSDEEQQARIKIRGRASEVNAS